MPMSKEQEEQARKYHHDCIHRRDDLKKLIKEMPPLDVYRTPPDDRNRSRCGCMTMSMRANEDLRSYLVVKNTHSLDDIPDDVLNTLPDLELWKIKQDSKETLFFFDRDSDAGQYDDTKLIVDRGWLELSNDMGWGWSKYREIEEIKARRAALPEEEKQRLEEKRRKELAGAAELALGIIRHDQRKAIKEMLKSWLPWNWFRK